MGRSRTGLMAAAVCAGLMGGCQPDFTYMPAYTTDYTNNPADFRTGSGAMIGVVESIGGVDTMSMEIGYVDLEDADGTDADLYLGGVSGREMANSRDDGRFDYGYGMASHWRYLDRGEGYDDVIGWDYELRLRAGVTLIDGADCRLRLVVQGRASGWLGFDGEGVAGYDTSVAISLRTAPPRRRQLQLEQAPEERGAPGAAGDTEHAPAR